MIFDLENGNWKNSEIMNLFANNIPFSNNGEEPIVVSDVVHEEKDFTKEAKAACYDMLIDSLELQEHDNHIINELNMVATGAAESGDIIAAALIEMAIEDLK